MPSWGQLLNEFSVLPSPEEKGSWLMASQLNSIRGIAEQCDGRNVIVYASGFLQKPTAQQFALQITHEDINALMSIFYGMDFTKGLTLVLHTPGGGRMRRKPSWHI